MTVKMKKIILNSFSQAIKHTSLRITYILLTFSFCQPMKVLVISCTAEVSQWTEECLKEIGKNSRV